MRALVSWTRLVLMLSVLLLCCQQATIAERFPGDTWLMYATPAEAGFSSEKLAMLREHWESTESAALLVVRDGAVVVAWGDIERRFMLHSVRKSVLGALYGIHVDAGRIDLNATLEQLTIDDVHPPLSVDEKRAQIIDLLRARSGVYHPAVSEPPGNPKPPPGSHAPGTHWCYNGWDFNALGTILEQEARIQIFEELKKRIADPLGMQDYRIRDGHYEYASEISIHPSYPIRMSARDMARFGLLYLNKGVWNGKRILSEDWVRKSTSLHSETGSPHGGYGYLWWIADTEPFRELGMASAIGVGEQSIDIIPGAGIVVVHRTDTYSGNRVSGPQRMELLRMVLDAVASDAVTNPRLVPLPKAPAAWTPREVSRGHKKALCGTLTLSLFGAADVAAEIVLDQGQLILESPMGRFGIIAVGDDRYVVEDVREGLYVEREEDGSVRQLRTETELIVEGYRSMEAGDLGNAIAVFERAVDYFPYSFNSHDSLGEAHMANGDTESAIRSYAKSLELNPNNIRAKEIMGVQQPADPAPGHALAGLETAAGRCAADFFQAYNLGDDESLRSFMERYKTRVDLEKRSLEERVREVRSLRDQFLQLEPIRLVQEADRQAIVLVRVRRTGEGLAFRFEMTQGDPSKMGAVKIRGPLPLDADDDAIIALTDR